MATNKDGFETTYRKVPGTYVVGKNTDDDTYSILHVDQNGHLFAKMVGDAGTTNVAIACDSDGNIKVASSNFAQVTYIDGTVIYTCTASIGTALNAAKWQVQKLDTATNIVLQWADGNDLYDNYATDLATVKALNYS